MKILIYGLNYSPELTGIGKYTGDMAEWYARKGYNVTVVTAPPYYPEWKIRDGYSGAIFIDEVVNNVRIFRCPLWVPKKLSTIKRILHLSSFSISSSLRLLILMLSKNHPDVVVTVVPTMVCAPMALIFSKFTKAKSWLHIQDFEIDAMFKMQMVSHNSIVSTFLYRMESWLMARFDFVSTISESMLLKLKEKRGKHGYSMLVPNWADVDKLPSNKSKGNYRQEWGLADRDFVILYSGNMGEKQGLSMVLAVAEALQNHDNIKFVFVGEGGEKHSLVNTAKSKKLENVQFHSLQPQSRLSELLSMPDLHLVVQKKDAADLVMPSKITGIFSAAGHSLITAASGTELALLVEQNPGIATLIEPEDPDLMGKVIIELFEYHQHKPLKPNIIAREYAESHLNRDLILSRMDEEMHQLVNEKST